MSLDKIKMVDAIGLDRADGTVVLSIVDSKKWIDEAEYLRALQDKINAYFEFIESGQVIADYPYANGRALRINIVSKTPMSSSALEFLGRASMVGAQINVTISHQTV